jgi:outer membrane beta-barrel protein
LLQHLAVALLALQLVLSHSAMAQSDLEEPGVAPSADKDVEDLYDKEDNKVVKSKAAGAEKSEKQPEAQNLSDLANLAPFEDIAVIQKRFLPKSNRFEASVGAFTNLNNPFFNSMGVSARLAYYLRERYALEAIGAFATTTTRQVTDDLETRPGCTGCTGITTDNVVTSKGFAALAFKWNPIYGKITWLNKTIVPFDINFNFGGGMTMTTDDETVPTVHLGTSQVFAWSKAMAFRWDLYWNLFQATALNAKGQKETLNQNDLFLGVGMSFYFPEATYR